MLARKRLGSAFLLGAVCYALSSTFASTGCDAECRPYEDDACDGNVAVMCPSTEHPHLNERDCGDGATCVGPNAGCGANAGCLNAACKPNQLTFCDGNELVSCCHDQPDIPRPCAGACVTTVGSDGLPYSFCATGPEPDPFCAGRAPCDVEHPCTALCDGNDYVECQGDYALQRSACPSGSTCIAGHWFKVCALSGQDPRCFNGFASSAFCDGNRLVDCNFAYPVATKICAKGCTEDRGEYHDAHCDP